MNYGKQELLFAQPIAEGLVNDVAFRSWILGKTKKFADYSGANLLHREMLAIRSKKTTSWWRSHYTETCRCSGCKGRETDLLAIFETSEGLRFAIHAEVKQPSDRFNLGQAAAYPIRAKCWVNKPPRGILAHTDAETVLLCSQSRLVDYGANLEHFDAIITFEKIATGFPSLSAGW